MAIDVTAATTRNPRTTFTPGGSYRSAGADVRAPRDSSGGTVAATDGHSAISIAPLERDDLPAADRVFRLAFGTQYGLADPLAFAAGSEMVRSRLHARHVRSFKASRNGELVGSAFLSRWGGLAVFGPLTVDPDAWGLGIGSRLLDTCLDVGDEWGVASTGLFTLPESTKHLHLYRRHGFWPGSLTALTETPVAPGAAAPDTLRRLDTDARAAAIEDCRAVTSAVCDGLDLTGEIECLADPAAGEVVIVRDAGRVAGFAVCHVGAGSEAVTGTCYVKFAAVCPGDEELGLFDRLLDACEALAADRGAGRLEAGISLGRRAAADLLAARGYRTFRVGVAMHRPPPPDDPTATPARLVLDDWR
jgi:GNAT superfamily N-acetyltransferase